MTSLYENQSENQSDVAPLNSIKYRSHKWSPTSLPEDQSKITPVKSIGHRSIHPIWYLSMRTYLLYDRSWAQALYFQYPLYGSVTPGTWGFSVTSCAASPSSRRGYSVKTVFSGGLVHRLRQEQYLICGPSVVSILVSTSSRGVLVCAEQRHARVFTDSLSKRAARR